MKRLLALLAVSALVLLLPPPASATSPGGNGRIAFNRGGDIYTVTARGTGLRRLTAYGGGARTPKWSADGKRIAYVYQGFIYTMRANGTHKVKRWAGTAPSWSPNGKKIAYVGLRIVDTGDERGLCTFPEVQTRKLVGGAITTIENYLLQNCWNGWASVTYGPTTAWSPDGTRVYYTYTGYNHDDNDPNATYSGAAYVMSDGSTVNGIPLYNYPDSTSTGTPPVMPTMDIAPTKPNYAIAVGSRTTSSYVISLDGTYLRSLTSDRTTSFPAYAPDGRSVLYTYHPDGDGYSIRKAGIPASGGAASILIARGSQADWQPVL
jgi:Tol biopolymer transport system component